MKRASMQSLRSCLSIIVLSCALCIFKSGICEAQQQAKVMTYNLLNYDAADTSRNSYFRTVINAARPDLLAVQEIIGLNSVNTFRRQVMNAVSINYNSAFFIDGPDTDNALFYDSSKFKFIFNTAIPTAYRNLNEFKMLHKASGDTFRIYACHLKADTGTLNQQRRAAQVDSLRKRTDALPQGTSFITCGDFNMYASTEPAYQKLILVNSSDGDFIDPLSMPGIWNNSSYAAYHTQSTRRRSFGSGATGGLDDRFDIILNSSSVSSSTGRVRYLTSSLNPIGNDGQHYNDSINRIPNNAVTQTVANALHYASDHLPVTSIYQFYPSSTSLNLTIAVEGFYNAVSGRLNIRDTITAYLRSTVSPFNAVDSSRAVIDSTTLSGQFIFSNVYTGLYYIALKGRNIIETWSRAGGELILAGSASNYDFSVSQSNAYGNNLTLNGSRFCIYSGDINNDGIVDAADVAVADNDAFEFVTGYVDSDVNGDMITDASDVQIVDNNAFNIVTRITP
jgi:endonuclease/exonuclease/phosphatase family metal-dependent hydrolase